VIEYCSGENELKKYVGALVASSIVFAMTFSAALAAAGMGIGDAREDSQELDAWTIMVYIAGDNNLQEQALLDLEEMELIGSCGADTETPADDVNIIVLLDTYDLLEGTHWYYVEPGSDKINLDEGINDCDCEEIAGECPGELNMGDGETLQNFIVTAVTYAPAEQYMLVLWDHGGGWYGACWDDSSVREVDNRIDRLTVDEMYNAIKAAEDETGARMTIIGFDACLMAMVEVAYEFRDLADYMVASVTGIPFDGWAYDLFLDDLVAAPSMGPEELGQAIIDGYVEYYSFCAGSGLGGWTGVTLSLIDLSVMDELALAVDEMSYTLQELLDSGELSRGTLAYAVKAMTPALEMYGEQFAYPDLGIFASLMADSCEAVADEATTVAELVESAVVSIDSVSQVNGGAFVTSGMTIYFPLAYYYTYVDYAYVDADEAAEAGEYIYYGMDFPIDTNWDEFLFSFCNALVVE
jgi:hypothetical protein